jgi:hypothetical protein
VHEPSLIEPSPSELTGSLTSFTFLVTTRLALKWLWSSQTEK